MKFKIGDTVAWLIWSGGWFWYDRLVVSGMVISFDDTVVIVQRNGKLERLLIKDTSWVSQ